MSAEFARARRHASLEFDDTVRLRVVASTVKAAGAGDGRFRGTPGRDVRSMDGLAMTTLLSVAHLPACDLQSMDGLVMTTWLGTVSP